MKTIETKILALENALLSHSTFWQNEILDQYFNQELQPQYFNPEFELSLEEILHTINHQQLPLHHPWSEYHQLLKVTSQLEKFPSQELDLSKFNFHRAPLKKRHEIARLLDFTQENIAPRIQSTVLDMAGGVGYLAQALTTRFNQHATLVDHNPSFQIKLKKRTTLNIDFFCFDLLSEKNLPIENLEHLYLLHGCGDLCDKSLEIFKKNHGKTLCSIGCCYHLKKRSITFLTNNLTLSNQALHLAAKTHKTLDLAGWKKRENQKHYRYAFEFWFRKKFLAPSPSLRSSPAALYQSDFETYAKVQLTRLKLEASDKFLAELKAEFEQGHSLRSKLINLGVVRNIFSRPIEVYIALRRAQYLNEFASFVSVGEIFDAQISPRNILLFAKY